MPDQNADRRAELIAAALVGELTEAEAAEFERMRASDPTIDAELVQLQGLTGNISGLPDWMEASPSEELRERVLGIAADQRASDGGRSADGAGNTSDTARVTPLRRPRFGAGLLVGIAAAGVVIGAVGASSSPARRRRRPSENPARSAPSSPWTSRASPPGSRSTGASSRTPGAPRLCSPSTGSRAESSTR